VLGPIVLSPIANATETRVQEGDSK
jgi:hypothetical protein